MSNKKSIKKKTRNAHKYDKRNKQTPSQIKKEIRSKKTQHYLMEIEEY